MRHEIEFRSPTFGAAVVVLLSWGEASATSGAHISFEKKGLSRLDVMQQGAELMEWCDCLVAEHSFPLPFDWVVLSSDLEFD